ncbi:MAG: hypothetical protein KGL39_03210 [Patescibacteria group bacterium]|nr:hypothetical protein [Patescibacteria group bacterium]
MPFVKNASYSFEHMQSAADPVRAVAEGSEHVVARQLLHAWTSLRFDPSRPVAELISALGAEVVPIERELVQAFTRGRVAMMRQISDSRVQKAIPQIGIGFDTLPPQTEEQAHATAAQLVREVSDDLRTTINGTVTDGLNEGLGPEEIAVNVRNGLGLTVSQSRAVASYRRALVARSNDALVRALRDRRFDPTVERAIASDTPLSPEQIDNFVGAYRRRYLNYRANTIARYEALNASNAGALAELKTAVGDGRLPRHTKKRWLIAHDELTCPACRSIPHLQPHGVPLDQDFQWEEGSRSGLVAAPALHPACRCTVTFGVL